ncbi:MAG: DUF4244 domain-containing protein [Actinomycetaceae bacterium]|nr:DUF4244 domain-containing protein [Actinomycetaceae bacterium]
MNTTIEPTLAIFDDSGEAGMATAEYAVGTVAATSFAGILVWLFKQDWVKDAIVSIFEAIFNL